MTCDSMEVFQISRKYFCLNFFSFFTEYCPFLVIFIVRFSRSYKILTGNSFCVRLINRRKHNQHSKLLFFKLNSHFGSSN